MLSRYSSNFKAVFNATVTSTTTDDVTSASWNLDTGENLLGLATQASGTAPIQVENVKSITQLPLTGAAGITMLVVVALLALLASVGTPAAPGAGAVILFTILSGVGFVNDKALLAYSLILAINRPIEMLVTSLNVVGDATSCICVAKSEGMLDEEKYNA